MAQIHPPICNNAIWGSSRLGFGCQSITPTVVNLGFSLAQNSSETHVSVSDPSINSAGTRLTKRKIIDEEVDIQMDARSPTPETRTRQPHKKLRSSESIIGHSSTRRLSGKQETSEHEFDDDLDVGVMLGKIQTADFFIRKRFDSLCIQKLCFLRRR
jgi:hypothetical protein